MDSLVSALTFESIPSFGNRLNEILGFCKDDLGSIMHTSILLCGLFSLLYIGNIVWQSWCNGGSINIYALFRPVVIVLVISNFTLFVNVLDTLCGWVNQPTQRLVLDYARKNQYSYTVEYLKMVNNMMSEDNQKEKEQPEVVLNGPKQKSRLGFGDSIREKMNSLKRWDGPRWYEAMVNMMTEIIAKRVVSLLSVVSLVCAIGILVVAFTSKLILIYLGPFAFAMSLIPYFSRSVASWIGRYVTVSLYAPCINIICFAILCIQNHAMPNMGVKGGPEIGLGYFLILTFASAFSFLSVPSISNYVVESCGAGGLTGEARGVVQRTAATALRMATKGKIPSVSTKK